MALGKQIRHHRKARGLTLEQLSEASGVDVGTISALEIRDSVRSKYAIPLAAAMGLSAEQLETLPAESFIEGESTRIAAPLPLLPSSNTKIPVVGAEFDANVTSVPLGLRPIPVISYIQAGLLTDINDPYALGEGFATEICEDDLGRFAFALEIEGDSMQPEFRPGDRIIIDPDVSPTPGDFVVAKNGKQMATFKKYRPRGMNEQGNQVFELVPLNEDYPTMRSDIEHLRIIGTMVEHRKKYRRKG